MYAAWGGNCALCELLVEEGGADPMHENTLGQNALHWAAAAGHLEVCQYLVGARYRKMLSLASEDNDQNSLIETIHHGQILEEDQNGLTPLDYAIQYNRGDIVDWTMKVI